jgi:hypothetical protein
MTLDFWIENLTIRILQEYYDSDPKLKSGNNDTVSGGEGIKKSMQI